ncbi:MAG: tRNA threonylcarbamoyladenosine dehydratase [Lentimicrobium sp.]|jgi:tRNA A37 threonylcarbamoyladenosine dehydratase|nr:tRNA threonylcarbamoyladenosine dehydratase [Lentimicrobium sp.]MDD2528869.1 tRNA threonylcarbamoyladenosine dehydratase [Lentimicrobiaceae bacterium]MDY0026105.1 tRNA threonylcarbamoyladenosine dehydratase [Lentimicrobium sp.]HAH57926.1 tRNA threonylcarbamoyladenosine dehydratase [Bacteroidales bacterium]
MKTPEWLSRTHLLLGTDNLCKLQQANVLVAGLGGVGAYAAEHLVRSGIGRLTIVDGDTVHTTNRNRQLPALVSTTGKLKAEVMRDRLLDINPELKITFYSEYIKDQRVVEILEQGFDHVVDAIDTLSPKVYLIMHTLRMGIPLVSSMGAGGKTDPAQVQLVDISQTHHCKLAYYIRKKLHKMDIWDGFKAVYSPETISRHSIALIEGEMNKKSTVGTISYMPALFGCMCAASVIKQLIDDKPAET